MAAAYSSEPWHDLFVGVAGAAAVLAGLLFVSLSINLRYILGQAWLLRRAALTLVLLFEALVIAILGLVPGQSPAILAVELLCLGGAVWLGATAVFTVRRPAIDQRGAACDADRREEQGDRADGEDDVADDVDGAFPAIELGQELPGGGLVEQGRPGQGEPVRGAPASSP